jgi:hypothetical protein
VSGGSGKSESDTMPPAPTRNTETPAPDAGLADSEDSTGTAVLSRVLDAPEALADARPAVSPRGNRTVEGTSRRCQREKQRSNCLDTAKEKIKGDRRVLGRVACVLTTTEPSAAVGCAAETPSDTLPSSP